MHQADVCIAGAGIIGLSLALELWHRGAQVTVLERDTPLSHASQAAAGMLAAHDPDNPPQLLPLSELSLRLYSGFLARIEALSGFSVPFQTSRTYQSVHHPPALHDILPPHITPGQHAFTLLHEHSIDPRQLAPALLAAIYATGIRLLSHTALLDVLPEHHPGTLRLETTAGPLATAQLVHTRGAWSASPVTPRKGQMLAVRIPADLPLDYVVRTPEIYIVPRTHGPRAGQAVLGATVEDAGFDTQTHPASLSHLRTLAARLIPALADPASAPMLSRWAGLRPHTPNLLPLLGPLDGNQFLATGHYRNGILLAPATAHVMAQLLAGEPPEVNLQPFAPTSANAQSAIAEPPIFAHSRMTNL